MPKKPTPYQYHRFIDEAGDMTFFGKGRVNLLGTEGVSKAFILGMVHIKEPLAVAREKINAFCNEVVIDPLFNQIISIQKRIAEGGFYLHAKDDPPELRYKFFTFLAKELKFSLQAIVGRKDVGRFTAKHHAQEREFYADLLSHLLKDKASYNRLVINIAQRGSSTRLINLEQALLQAQARYTRRQTGKDYATEIQFNVQHYRQEPLLVVADYSLWAVQRVFERGETRFYDAIRDKVAHVIDLYDVEKYEGWNNYYGPKHPLTKGNQV